MTAEIQWICHQMMKIKQIKSEGESTVCKLKKIYITKNLTVSRTLQHIQHLQNIIAPNIFNPSKYKLLVNLLIPRLLIRIGNVNRLIE